MRVVHEPMQRRSALLHVAALAASTFAPLAPPPIAHAISATTMTGKSKPELGVILVSAPTASGSAISAELVLSSGLLATVGFRPEAKWDLQDGGYYDVEAKNREGDAAFVQVATAPSGNSLAKLPASFFTGAVMSVEGRYGTYGAPIDVKVLSDTTEGASRLLEVSFSVLSASTAEISRRALLKATQPAGGNDVVMLVSSTSTSRWKKSGGEAGSRKATSSFEVSTRPTQVKYSPASDYRFGKTSGPSNMRGRNDGPIYTPE